MTITAPAYATTPSPGEARQSSTASTSGGQTTPDEAPTDRPTLDERVEINRVTDALVRAVAASAHEQEAPLCALRVLESAIEVTYEYHLDKLHRTALARSLESVCQ